MWYTVPMYKRMCFTNRNLKEKFIGAVRVSKAIEASKIDNQKNILKNKHLRE